MIVVDASLATKWRLAEPDSEAALTFLATHEHELCGPDILAIEVCRALVAAANAGRIDRPAAHRAVDAWLETIERGGLRLYPLGTRLIGRGTEIALTLGHPLIDCLYLALALEIGTELATSDAKFAAKAQSHYTLVRLLSDYG